MVGAFVCFRLFVAPCLVKMLPQPGQHMGRNHWLWQRPFEAQWPQCCHGCTAYVDLWWNLSWRRRSGPKRRQVTWNVASVVAVIWFQGVYFYLDDLHCFDVEEPQQRERDFVQSKCNFAICSIICSIDRSSAKENHTAIQRPDDLFFFGDFACVSVFAFYIFLLCQHACRAHMQRKWSGQDVGNSVRKQCSPQA